MALECRKVSFRNYSVSSAYAKGIWQLQWAGRKYGLRGGDYFDIVKSTRTQLKYLKKLVQNFSLEPGNWFLVDYNYGPGKKFTRYRSDPKRPFEESITGFPGRRDDLSRAFWRPSRSAWKLSATGCPSLCWIPEPLKLQPLERFTIWNSDSSWERITGTWGI